MTVDVVLDKMPAVVWVFIVTGLWLGDDTRVAAGLTVRNTKCTQDFLKLKDSKHLHTYPSENKDQNKNRPCGSTYRLEPQIAC